jgi:hypothetical protein
VTWALYGLVIVVVGVFAFSTFLSLQSVSQTLANALSTLERVHHNDGKRIDQILDRLMAMDFETFKNYQLAEEADIGGQEFPEGDETEATVVLERPGLTRSYGEVDLRRAAEERQILMEDFPAEEEAKA